MTHAGGVNWDDASDRRQSGSELMSRVHDGTREVLAHAASGQEQAQLIGVVSGQESRRRGPSPIVTDGCGGP